MKHLENPLILWSIIILLTVIIFMTRTKNVQNISEAELELLEIENKVLKENIEARTQFIISQKKIIDSLENLKPKIKIRYEKIYENITVMPVDSVVAEFDSIFAKEGIAY